MEECRSCSFLDCQQHPRKRVVSILLQACQHSFAAVVDAWDKPSCVGIHSIISCYFKNRTHWTGHAIANLVTTIAKPIILLHKHYASPRQIIVKILEFCQPGFCAACISFRPTDKSSTPYSTARLASHQAHDLECLSLDKCDSNPQTTHGQF